MSSLSNRFRTERLILRAIEDDDADLATIQALENDPVNQAYTSSELLRPQNRKSAKETLERYIGKDTHMSALICLPPTTDTPDVGSLNLTTSPPAATGSAEAKVAAEKAKPTPIGLVALWADEPTAAHHRDAFFSIMLTEEQRGKGYGGEVLRWLLEYAFRTANLHAVRLIMFGYNASARRLYEKLGFVLDGTHRETLWFDGQWWDTLEFSMLDREWAALRDQGRV